MEEPIYRLLFENSLQGMVLHQGEKFVMVNQSFADSVGYTIEELMTFSLTDVLQLVHPRDRKNVLERFQDLMAGQQGPGPQVYRFRRRDGHTGWWTAALTMVTYQGQPAILGVYDDITERRLAEEALTRRRDLLSATLNILPVGVCLTDQDGFYRLMNDAYCAIYEYDREELLGKHYSVIMPPDQVEIGKAQYARLLSGDTGLPVERKRQTKDGSIVYIEAANALFQDEAGRKMVITTVRDITERKRSEEITRLRLRLMEYAANHTILEVMEHALDELEILTGSTIGFYHLVSDNQHEILLQAFSSKTLGEYCHNDGARMHYPVNEAGVWADAIRQRQTVVHNDYATLSSRKGLPDGHPGLVRELITPSFRNGHVMTVLGIANKPSDYNQRDIDLVEFIADLVCSIIEQKQRDDHIRELNTLLQRMAMVDELTDLPNRRAFFAQAEKETLRARRYKTPYSLLMLDVDNFKQVNDTFGHAAGDQVLQNIARLLAASIRQVDMAARMGGEEFSVLLPDTRISDAAILAERIRAAVEQGMCEVAGRSIGVTVSIGVSTYSIFASDLEAVLKRADACLYRAKEGGRNRVVVD